MNIQPTLQDIKIAKRKLEGEISEKLTAFSRQYGCELNISSNYAFYSAFHGENIFTYNVKIDINL